MARYSSRVYGRTQAIGAAVAFLNYDGLIVPNARWDCENLVIFTNNRNIEKRLAVVQSEDVDWQDWAVRAGLLDVPSP